MGEVIVSTNMRDPAYIGLHNHPISSHLQSVSEPLKILNQLASSRCSLIRLVKLERHCKRDNDDKPTSNNRSVDTWPVTRLVLVSEHSATNNAADAASADQSGGAQSALPLATNVVCLVGEHAGNVGIASDSGDKGAEIADAVVLRKAEKRETYEFVIMFVCESGITHGFTNQEEHAVNKNEWSSDMVLVSQISPAEHDNCRGHGGRADEALRGGHGETHSFVENDGEKVGQRVGAGGCEHE